MEVQDSEMDRISGYMKCLKKEGVPSLIMETEGISSTASIALAVPGRDKSTIHSRGASQTFVADNIQGELLKDADWFHFTGITPAISDRAASAVLDAVKAAHAAGVTVSCDLLP